MKGPGLLYVGFAIILGISCGPAEAWAGFYDLQEFQRGDVNADGKWNIADAIGVLGFLFLGDPADLD